MFISCLPCKVQSVAEYKATIHDVYIHVYNVHVCSGPVCVRVNSAGSPTWSHSSGGPAS